jgi:hypothetical protein
MLDQLLEVQLYLNEVTRTPEPLLLVPTPEAKRLWIEFHDEHSAEQAELHGELSAAWSKLTGYAARFSLICELADWAVSESWDQPPVSIGETAMKAGITLARWFSWETKRIYDSFGESDEDSDICNLIDYIRRQGGFVASRDLTRGPRRYRGNPDLAEADLEKLVLGGAGRWIPQPTGRDGGRPTRVFCLNGYIPGDETPFNPAENEVSSPSPLNWECACNTIGEIAYSPGRRVRRGGWTRIHDPLIRALKLPSVLRAQ